MNFTIQDLKNHLKGLEFDVSVSKRTPTTENKNSFIIYNLNYCSIERSQREGLDINILNISILIPHFML